MESAICLTILFLNWSTISNSLSTSFFPPDTSLLEPHFVTLFWSKIKISRGFPSSSVVKSPPANARDTGSIPGPACSTCCGATSPCGTTIEPALSSQRTTTPEGLQVTESMLCNKRRHHSEKHMSHNQRVVPAHHNWRKNFVQQ